MAKITHIIDRRSDRASLRMLARLVRPGEDIVSLGPAPAWAAPLEPRMIRCPLGSPALGVAMGLRPKAGDILHAWTPSAGDWPFLLAAGDASLLMTKTETHRIASRNGRRAWCAPRSHATEMNLRAAEPCREPAAARRAVRAALGIGADDPVFIATGEMHRPAGHEYALWAMAILRRIGLDSWLLLPGGGPAESRLRYTARTLDPSPKDLFLGDRFDAADLLAAADVGLWLAERPICAIELAEVMTAGLAVVASYSAIQAAPAHCAAGGIRADANRAVRDKDQAETPSSDRWKLVPARDPRRIAASMLELAENPKLRSELGERARRFACERFTVAAARETMDQAYDNLHELRAHSLSP